MRSTNTKKKTTAKASVKTVTTADLKKLDKKLSEKMDALRTSVEIALGKQNEDLKEAARNSEQAAINTDKILAIAITLGDEYKPMIDQLNNHEIWIKELRAKK
jgi:hypothetical protein